MDDTSLRGVDNCRMNDLEQSSLAHPFESWPFIFKELITRNRRLSERIGELEKQFHHRLNDQNERLNTAQGLVKGLHNENEQLKRQFEEHVTRCNTFSTGNQSFIEQISQCQRQFQKGNETCTRQLDETNDRLNACIIQLNVRLNSNEIQIKKFDDENRQLKEQVDRSEKQTQQQQKKFTEQFNEAHIRFSECLRQFNEQSKICKELQNEINQLRMQIIEHNTTFTKGENDNSSLKLSRCAARFTIDLRRQELTDQGMETAVEYLVINEHCKHLQLDHNRITAIGASIVADALSNNNTLQQLSLSHNDISDDGVYSLVRMLSDNNTLEGLHLGNNRITDTGAKYLAQMLTTNKTLTRLYLQRNMISDEGVQLLANAIEKHNSTIEDLSLYSNKLLTDLSVDFLLQMIRNHRSLKKLYVFDCHLSQIGKERLVRAQQSKTNFQVYVNNLNN